MLGKIFTILGIVTVAVRAFEIDLGKELGQVKQEVDQFIQYADGFRQIGQNSIEEL